MKKIIALAALSVAFGSAFAADYGSAGCGLGSLAFKENNLTQILAATTNVMAAQILVVASNLSEDLYKKIFQRTASSSS